MFAYQSVHPHLPFSSSNGPSSDQLIWPSTSVCLGSGSFHCILDDHLDFTTLRQGHFTCTALTSRIYTVLGMKVVYSRSPLWQLSNISELVGTARTAAAKLASPPPASTKAAMWSTRSVHYGVYLPSDNIGTHFEFLLQYPYLYWAAPPCVKPK